MSTRLKFYSGTRNASSWAMRAWLALREAGVDFDEEVVDIRRPQRFANLARIGAMSPSATVPVLETPAGVIFDSLAIMEYANDLIGGGLLPRDVTLRGRARAVAAWQHAGLSGLCSAISFESAFYPLKRALTAHEAGEAGQVFRMTEALLAESGGPYLFGAISLADLALVPAVIRLTSHRFDFGDLHRAWSWAEALCDRPSVREWMDDARTAEPIWYDAYLEPGVGPLHATLRAIAPAGEDVPGA